MTSLQLRSSSAFTVSHPVPHQQFRTEIVEHSCLYMADIVGEAPRPNMFGGDDVELEKGDTIQTTKGLKAYQVPKKGAGSFADDKSFEPLDYEKEGGVTRADKCLIMPKGLRGVVAKVYDTNESDASHPVYVKFIGKDGLGGEYTPPITFHMHLKNNEVEVVDE